jgi:hypothetical protein
MWTWLVVIPRVFCLYDCQKKVMGTFLAARVRPEPGPSAQTWLGALSEAYPLKRHLTKPFVLVTLAQQTTD